MFLYCCGFISYTFFFFFFNDTATTEIYTLSLHDALPIHGQRRDLRAHGGVEARDDEAGRAARGRERAGRPVGATHAQHDVGALLRAAGPRSRPRRRRRRPHSAARDVRRRLEDPPRDGRRARRGNHAVRLRAVEQTYFRKGFGLKGAIEGALAADYHSRVVDAIRGAGYELVVGDLTFKLAGEFGFCYGVDRAVEYAYETRT